MSFTLPASYGEADRATQRLCQAAAPYLDAERLLRFELAIAEALNNIVRHAYGEVPGKMIDVGLFAAGDGVHAVLRDTGAPPPAGLFDRRAQASHEQDETTIDPLAESGRGMMVIGHSVDQLSYRRAAQGNELTLTVLKTQRNGGR